VVPYTEAAPNKALHLTAYSLRLAALCSGFRQQVSLGVRLCHAPHPLSQGEGIWGKLNDPHSAYYDIGSFCILRY
jgi:hypothetical protein